MRHYCILLAILEGIATLCGCASQFNIDGNSSIAGLDGQKMYLRISTCDGPGQTICLDSCEVVHGMFSFGGAVDSVAMADLYIGSFPMMPVVLEDGRLFVQMDNMMQTISGGPLNERLNTFLAQRNRCEASLMDLDRRARMMMYEGKSLDQILVAFDPVKNTLIDQLNALDAAFVRENYTNVLGPGYFMRICTDAKGFPRNDSEIISILADAPQSFLANPFIDHFLSHAGITSDMLDACRKHPVADKPKMRRFTPPKAKGRPVVRPKQR